MKEHVKEELAAERAATADKLAREAAKREAVRVEKEKGRRTQQRETEGVPPPPRAIVSEAVAPY
jgi:hypothetical protein